MMRSDPTDPSRDSAASGPLRPRRWAIACLGASLIALLPALNGCTGGASPTLPIPPPTALSSPPDADGFITVSGQGAVEGAIVAAYNEDLAEGTLGEAAADGTFSLRLRGRIDDTITVWQRVGTDTSQLVSVSVPSP